MRVTLDYLNLSLIVADQNIEPPSQPMDHWSPSWSLNPSLSLMHGLKQVDLKTLRRCIIIEEHRSLT